MTDQNLDALIAESARIPNGCDLATEEDMELLEDLLDDALDFELHWKQGTKALFRWSPAFESWLKYRGSILEDSLRDGNPVLPWREWNRQNGRLPSAERQPLYFSQRNKPSCMGHADDFAYRSSIMNAIQLAAPVNWTPTNPFAAWKISKGGSERGGQSVTKMMNTAIEIGHIPISFAGSDNTSVRSGYDSSAARIAGRELQSSCVVMQYSGASDGAEKIMAAVRAGCAVALGNSTRVSGSTTDTRGMRVPVFGGSWAHATSFTAWTRWKGTEYAFWTNSHGPLYRGGEMADVPYDGCWMDHKAVATFLNTASGYGFPYIVLGEARTTSSGNVQAS